MRDCNNCPGPGFDPTEQTGPVYLGGVLGIDVNGVRQPIDDEGIVHLAASTQEAVDAAERADQSAEDAAGSATEAANSATDAAGSATAAAASAAEAQTAAERDVPAAAAAWLAEHVDPATGYVIDNSLSIQGAAADAKAVGNKLADTDSTVSSLLESEKNESSYRLDVTLMSSMGSIIASDGSVASSSAYYPTDFINISGFYAIAYKRIGSTGSDLVAGMAFYDADKNYVSGKIGARSQSAAGYLRNLAVAVVPDNAKYARFTTYANVETRGTFELYGIGNAYVNREARLDMADKSTISPTLIAVGTINISGNNATDITSVRTVKCINNAVTLVDAGEYLVSVHAYTSPDSGYIGTMCTNGQFSSSSQTNLYGTTQWSSQVDLAALRSLFPSYYYRLVFKASDSRQLSTDIAESITAYYEASKLPGLVHQSKRVVDTVSEYYALFEDFVTGGFCTKTLIATVESLPIYQYDFSGMDGWVDGSDYTLVTDTRLFDKHQVLITAGMHGDEKNATIALYEFVRNLCYNQKYRSYLALCDFHIIPICNPTGYNLNTRNNYQDKNINRIDEAGDTAECQAIMGVIDAQAYDLYIDCHTMRRGGKTDSPDEIGIMSFANATTEDVLIKEWRTVMNAGAITESVIRNLFVMENNNNIQHIFPWRGQNVESFRQYGYTHQSGGRTVGAPISGTFECSDTCYIFSGSTVDNNGTAQFICVNFADKIFTAFLDEIIDGLI